MIDPTRLNEYNLSEKSAIDFQGEAAYLREVKHGLMQKLLSGEVRV